MYLLPYIRRLPKKKKILDFVFANLYYTYYSTSFEQEVIEQLINREYINIMAQDINNNVLYSDVINLQLAMFLYK